MLAHLLGDEEEEVDHVLGLAGKARAQHRVLRGDADRAGVQVALAHHDAAHGDQRHGGKAELLGAEQGGDHHIAAGLQLAVGLHADAAAQVVEQQHLLGFSQAELPGQAGVLDGAERRSAGAAIVAGDEHDVGMRLGDAGGNRAYADFRDQLDRDARLRIDVLEVVDQLRQIFDGVDVVVRRRRNQADAGNRVARSGDHLIHLVAGQLATLAGLGALRHLDLEFVGVDQIVGGDAEAAAGHLLDGAAAQIAVGVGREALFVLAAFAGVRHAADAVHGDGQRLVRFLADGPEAHGAGRESLDDLLGRLDLFNRNGLVGVLELEQSAQSTELAVLLVDQVGVLLEGGRVVLPHRVLHLADGERIEQVILAALAVLILAADDQIGLRLRERLEGVGMLHLRLAGQHVQADALDARGGAGEVGVDQRFVQAHCLKDLRAAIALQSADAHLREGLQQALVDGLDEVLLGIFGSDALPAAGRGASDRAGSRWRDRD